jgi:hypothetical protein
MALLDELPEVRARGPPEIADETNHDLYNARIKILCDETLPLFDPAADVDALVGGTPATSGTSRSAAALVPLLAPTASAPSPALEKLASWQANLRPPPLVGEWWSGRPKLRRLRR